MFKLFLPAMIQWALNNADDVLEAALPEVAQALKLKPGAARTLQLVVPALVAGATDIHEASPDFQTPEGALAVIAEIKDFIDETGDDWPIWDDWEEAERDAFLVHAFVTISGVMRMIREAGDRGERFTKGDIRKAVKRTIHPVLKRQMARLRAAEAASE